MFRGRVVSGLRLLALAVSLVLTLAPAAKAETIPLPKIDYEAKATLLNDGSLLTRHSKGKMRIEVQMRQLKETMIGFIDLNRKVMVLLLPIPGMQDTADTVAGERCTIWKVSSNDNRAEACITPDGIALRTRAAIEGKTQTVFEVTELKRQPQKPADLEVPPSVNIMKLPKGIKGIPGFPQL
ncbi:MAG: hypothetical protein IPK23_01625 [Rhizobiales bacterium]|nr:hypothetical protein [Hyphomicrobiales bacterium]